jgi:S-adenosylmethionine:tRNA ribosyltransferase-isomerase
VGAEARAALAEPPELDAYDYALPPERIAQHPAPERDAARLMVLERGGGAAVHGRVRDLPRWLRPGDLVVVNATRVLPARLRGHKASGGAAEALLLGPAGAPDRYRALVRARGRLRTGLRLSLGAPPLDCEIAALGPAGEVVLAFAPGARPYDSGETPLPPYIRRDAPDPADAERYQTLYAREPGSVAAPTAGLHLSERVLAELAAAGVERAEVVLHVGPGTFRPVSEEALATGRLHAEPYELSEATAQAVARARERGGRVVAVGTTATRVLEACARDGGRVEPGRGATHLFVRPGHRFRAVDALLTNFHLPRSSLLLLVAAFAGRERVLAAYREAVARGYRFYSYGDAMLVQ